MACSLAPAELEARTDEIDRLLTAQLVDHEWIEGAVRLRFRSTAEVKAALVDLVRREQRCCPFLGFTLDDGGGSLMLEVSAPEPVHELLAPFVPEGSR